MDIRTNPIKRLILLALAAIATAIAASTASAQYTFTTLVNFNGTNGAWPRSGLIADASGNLYGTTSFGGAVDAGTVFELAAGTHAYTTLASFDPANGGSSDPEARLTIDASGNLYGIATGGDVAFGNVFEVAAGAHVVTKLATFNSSTGSQVYSGLIADAGGNLYGTAQEGGDFTKSTFGLGTVFEVAAGTHAITTLATFNGTNGAGPMNNPALIVDANGNFYGTTWANGPNNDNRGSVFEVAAGTHTITTLASFNRPFNQGTRPVASVIADANGNLYGTTSGGGDLTLNNGSGYGTVFEVAAGTHALTTLVSFNGANGNDPEAGLIVDANGNLYGTTNSGGANNRGTVFKIDAVTHALTTLVSFNSKYTFSGSYSVSSLLADADGNLYGTTSGLVFNGSDEVGTVFELSPVPEPASLVLAACGLAMGVFTICRRWRQSNNQDRRIILTADH